MLKLVPFFAVLSVAAAPALAQSTTPPTQPAEQAPAQPKTVKKVVCKKIVEERSVGSRLNSTTKVCKTVEVPADEQAHANHPGQGGKAR